MYNYTPPKKTSLSLNLLTEMLFFPLPTSLIKYTIIISAFCVCKSHLISRIALQQIASVCVSDYTIILRQDQKKKKKAT